MKLWLAVTLLSVGAVAGVAQTNKPSGVTDDSIRRVILLVAHHQIQPLAAGEYPPVKSLSDARAAKPPVGIAWSNPYGITLCGLLRVSEATGDKEVESFVLTQNRIITEYHAWLKNLRLKLTNESAADLDRFTDSTALAEFMKFDRENIMDYCGTMGIEFMEAILRHSDGKPDAGQLRIVQSIADYINDRQGRLPDGTFWRPTWQGTVWADDLYKSCAFLARWSEFTRNPKYLDDAAKQIINMSALLQDQDGLWYHGYFYREHRNNGAKWGRANGWAMIATVEVLSAMSTNHPARPKLLGILQRHITAVKKVQQPSGMWPQLLDHPELWEETSCTALFAYCIARAAGRGWIAADNMAVARKAFVGVCRHVRADGVITDACAGSGIFWDFNYYATRAHPDDEPHGRGPVMMAGAEILSAKPPQ